MKYMSLNRFQQVKRYFHIAALVAMYCSTTRCTISKKKTPIAALPKEREEEPLWWMKVEPLASSVHSKCQQLMVPSTQVAIDEMMVLFCGRSHHTVKMPNKPISQGIRFMICVIIGIPTTLPSTRLPLNTLMYAIIISDFHLP